MALSFSCMAFSLCRLSILAILRLRPVNEGLGKGVL